MRALYWEWYCESMCFGAAVGDGGHQTHKYLTIDTLKAGYRILDGGPKAVCGIPATWTTVSTRSVETVGLGFEGNASSWHIGRASHRPDCPPNTDRVAFRPLQYHRRRRRRHHRHIDPSSNRHTTTNIVDLISTCRTSLFAKFSISFLAFLVN